jgi:hypothetical protein
LFARGVAAVAAVIGLVLGLIWYGSVYAALPRADLRFAGGDAPGIEQNCGTDGGGAWVCGPDTWTWHLSAGQTVRATGTPPSPENSRGLYGKFRRDDDCTGAVVSWQVATDGQMLSAGTLPAGHDSLKIPARRATGFDTLTITLARTDNAPCTTRVALDPAGIAYKSWWFW